MTARSFFESCISAAEAALAQERLAPLQRRSDPAPLPPPASARAAAAAVAQGVAELDAEEEEDDALRGIPDAAAIKHAHRRRPRCASRRDG